MFRGDPAHTGVQDSPDVKLEPQRIWRFRTGDRVLWSPTICGSIVYVGSFDGGLYAFETRGKRL